MKCIRCNIEKDTCDFYSHSLENYAYICKKCEIKRITQWRKKNPESSAKASRKQYKKVRERIIFMLGGKCEVCDIADQRVLQINHKNRGGTKDIKSYGSNYEFYRAILRGERKTEDLNILCANHNMLFEENKRRKYV